MPPPSFPTATAAPAVPATLPSYRTALVLTALGAGHLAITARTGGIRWEHLLADGLIMVLPWLGVKGRRVALAFLPLWFTGVLVEWQKFLVLLGPIHTGDFRAL
ncbi:MAG TPA: hypothetical protein VK454_13745, partial [Myxococcaceae bacterium]|nr:hypothetical protein [Myxococcaceae bacterium]